MSRGHLCYLALLVFFALNLGNIQSHICLDGLEPPVSYHLENLDGHPDHGDSEVAHADVEGDALSDFLLSKQKPQEIPLLQAFCLLFLLPAPRRGFARATDVPLPGSRSHTLLPPLRAPPAV